MKKLIYEYTDRIEARKKYASELVNNLNFVLTRFKSSYNDFGQGIDENFAFQLVSQPVETFDDLLRANSPIKPIAGKPLDIEKLAELCSIDRAGFIAAFTVTLPGSVDNYNRAGRTGIIKLNERDKSLVSWHNGSFTLNVQALSAECELYRVYATDADQLAEVEYWENLAKVLNSTLDRKLIMDSDVFRIAQQFGLKNDKYRFIPNYQALAGIIKSMVPVN